MANIALRSYFLQFGNFASSSVFPNERKQKARGRTRQQRLLKLQILTKKRNMKIKIMDKRQKFFINTFFKASLDKILGLFRRKEAERGLIKK